MSDGVKRKGQFLDQEHGIIIPFYKQMLDYTGDNLEGSERSTGAEGNVATEQIPQDRDAAEITVTDIAAFQTAIASVVDSYDDTADIPLPDVLTGVTITHNKTHADGSETHPTSQQEFLSVVVGGSVAQGSFNPTSSAEGTAVIMPSINPVIERAWTQNLPVKVYLFYMARGSTGAQIRTRLAQVDLAGATVNVWPTFTPVSHTITIVGQAASVQAKADARASLAVSTTRYDRTRQWGSGSSKRVEITVRTETLPPTIHGAITFTGSSSDTDTATADVEASTLAIEGETDYGSFTCAAISNNPSAVTHTVTGSVTPASLSATTPAAYPASGLYLYKLYSQPYKFGYNALRAIVFDFANI